MNKHEIDITQILKTNKANRTFGPCLSSDTIWSTVSEAASNPVSLEVSFSSNLTKLVTEDSGVWGFSMTIDSGYTLGTISGISETFGQFSCISQASNVNINISQKRNPCIITYKNSPKKDIGRRKYTWR